MLKIQDFLSTQALVVALVLGVSIFPTVSMAQEKEKGKEKIEAEGRIIRTTEEVEKPKESKKIIPTQEEAKLFLQLKQQADMDAVRARLSAAEWRALYWELNHKYKIDLEKWDLAFDKEGMPVWIEKQQAAGAAGAEKPKEK